MKRILLALCLIAAAVPAWATDLIIRANSQALMASGLWTLGMMVGPTPPFLIQDTNSQTGVKTASRYLQGHGRDGSPFFVVIIPSPQVPSGATAIDQFGNQQPVMKTFDTGFWCTLRWLGPLPVFPASITAYVPTIDPITGITTYVDTKNPANLLDPAMIVAMPKVM